MYTCNVHISFSGCSRQIEGIIQSIPPLDGFVHDFGRSDQQARGTRLLIAGPDANIELLPLESGIEIILVSTNPERISSDILGHIQDIWHWPLSEEELRFHFGKWQHDLKHRKDLSEKNHFLEQLMETSPNLVWFKTRAGLHELVNGSFCAAVNKTREQVQGQGHAYIWDVEKDDPACIESERLVMESGQTQTSEEQIETGEGHRILKVYKSPLHDDDDSMMGTLGIGIDVTKEREYLNKLIQNNVALETLFTTMNCGIITHTLDGSHVLSANKTALRLLGFASLDELDAGFNMVAGSVFEEDKAKLRKEISRLKNEGDSVSYEYRIQHPDGVITHVMGNARLAEKDGNLICERFLLDCTAQKVAEEKELREREKRQRELVRALSVDFQLACVYGSESEKDTVLQLLEEPDPRLKEIFEKDAPLSDKISAYIAECVHPDDREVCRKAFSLEHLRDSLAREPIVYFNYRVLNGNDIHYFQMKAVRAGGLDAPYGIVLGLQSVDMRTREDMEQKCMLAEALKQAQHASNAKSVFLSNMSHDIRTPLNAILGYTSLAMANPDRKEAVSGYLGRILDSGNHLISLINDILDMSHIESGKIQLEENACSLRALVEEICHIVQPEADRKNQTLKIDMSGIRIENVYCDKLRLKQVLLNLLSNSIKYTENDGVINMSVRELANAVPNQAAYEIIVRDNGIGMSPEFLAVIFEPFERAHTSAIQSIQGTGLGMAIAKSIVDIMKGDIKVSSKLGVGTEFRLQLAFRIAGDEALALAETESHAGSLNAGAKILLAEDNDMNQEIAQEFLTGAGYDVEIAENGELAVEMLKNAPTGYYDLVLMDVQMPIMDGYTATGHIRALPDKQKSSIPIVAMTANSFEEDRQRALSSGMNAHIAKPIDFKALFKTMDGLLAGNRA